MTLREAAEKALMALTDGQIDRLHLDWVVASGGIFLRDFARRVEASHGIGGKHE